MARRTLGLKVGLREPALVDMSDNITLQRTRARVARTRSLSGPLGGWNRRASRHDLSQVGVLEAPRIRSRSDE